MVRRILASSIFAVASISAPALAAENQSAVSTILGPSARYQIVQSELAARNTFRVDKACGSVAQLVVDNEEQNHWQSMPVESKPPCEADGRTHYQLFMSGLAAKFTFLMNTDSGATWQLVVDTQQNLSWELLR